MSSTNNDLSSGQKGTPKPPTSTSTRNKPVFARSDLHLLQSGEHADVRIVCCEGEQCEREVKSFRCHKAILGRSEWFRDQLKSVSPADGLGNPDNLPVIKTIQPAVNVEKVLSFIYAGEVDFKPIMGESAIVTYILIFNLGRAFGVEGMSDFATNALGTFLSPVLANICDQGLAAPIDDNKPEIDRYLRRSNFITAFLDAVIAADNVRFQAPGNQNMRPFAMLVDFFVAAKEVMMQQPKVREFVAKGDVPEFAKSVLLVESSAFKTVWMRNLVPAPPAERKGKKDMCWGCNTSLRTGGMGLVNPKSRQVTYAQACCHACTEEGENTFLVGGETVTKWEVFEPKL